MSSEKGGMPPGSRPYPTQQSGQFSGMPSNPPPYSPSAPPQQQHAPLPGQQQMYGLPGSGMQYGVPQYPGAPPAYGAPPPAQYFPPHQQGYPPQQQGFSPQHQQQYPSQQRQYSTNTTVVVNNGFDSGARFDSRTGPSIPPPPPGVMPNAAQMAASQGHNVVLKQQKGGFVKGSGSGAGYTFW